MLSSTRPAFWLALLSLLMLAGRPAAAQRPSSKPGTAPAARPPVQTSAPAAVQDPLDVQVLIIARGGTTEPISIAYWAPATDAEVEQDFRTLAAELRKAPVRPRIKRGAPRGGGRELTSADAELPGLLNYNAGVIQLDPLLTALKRFRHINFTYLFVNKFNLTWPVGEQQRGPVRWKTQINGQTISYDVRIDQSQPLPGRLPSTGQWGLTWVWIAGLAAGAVLLVGGLFYWVYAVTHRRQPELAEPEGQ